MTTKIANRKPKHKEGDLPNWARARLRKLRRELAELAIQVADHEDSSHRQIRAIEDLALDVRAAKERARIAERKTKQSVTMPKPDGFSECEPVILYCFRNNHPFQYAVVHPGDTVTIHRRDGIPR